MTSAEFISRQLGNNDGKTRTLSSIYKDGRGVIYSYYKHYPLVFNVKGLTIVNTRGYSNTTAKHINWAWKAADYVAVGVDLQGCNQYSWSNPENRNRVPYMLSERANGYIGAATDDMILEAILEDLTVQKDAILKSMEVKKRKDTAIYSGLERDFQMACGYIARVKAAL